MDTVAGYIISTGFPTLYQYRLCLVILQVEHDGAQKQERFLPFSKIEFRVDFPLQMPLYQPGEKTKTISTLFRKERPPI